MQPIPNMSPKDATIAVLSRNPSGPIKAVIKAQLIRGTRKQIMIKAQAEKSTAWTPELVMRRMHKDSDPKIFVCYELAGIDEAKLLEIARQALENIGIKCPVAISTLPAATPEASKALMVKKHGLLARIWSWIKNLFRRRA